MCKKIVKINFFQKHVHALEDVEIFPFNTKLCAKESSSNCFETYLEKQDFEAQKSARLRSRFE